MLTSQTLSLRQGKNEPSLLRNRLQDTHDIGRRRVFIIHQLGIQTSSFQQLPEWASLTEIKGFLWTKPGRKGES